jgi:hypothetical protein
MPKDKSLKPETDHDGNLIDPCHFFGMKGFEDCLEGLAWYARRENSGTKQYFDACYNCARKPYPEKNLEN